jgi:hypothetical protein
MSDLEEILKLWYSWSTYFAEYEFSILVIWIESIDEEIMEELNDLSSKARLRGVQRICEIKCNNLWGFAFFICDGNNDNLWESFIIIWEEIKTQFVTKFFINLRPKY